MKNFIISACPMKQHFHSIAVCVKLSLAVTQHHHLIHIAHQHVSSFLKPTTRTMATPSFNSPLKRPPFFLRKSFSKIEENKAEIDIKDIATIGADLICPKQLQDKEDSDRVIVQIKVVKVHEEETMGDGKRKQDVEVADKVKLAIHSQLLSNDHKEAQVGQKGDHRDCRHFKPVHAVAHEVISPTSGNHVTECDGARDGVRGWNPGSSRHN